MENQIMICNHLGKLDENPYGTRENTEGRIPYPPPIASPAPHISLLSRSVTSSTMASAISLMAGTPFAMA